jgi:hypothetical protein
MQLKLNFDTPSFQNTTGLRGSQLQAETRNAISQEREIECFFRAYCEPWHMFTPEDVWEATGIEHLHSVRRAISVLKKRGILIKTDKMKPGKYGKPVHAYAWNPNPETNPLIPS